MLEVAPPLLLGASSAEHGGAARGSSAASAAIPEFGTAGPWKQKAGGGRGARGTKVGATTHVCMFGAGTMGLPIGNGGHACGA